MNPLRPSKLLLAATVLLPAPSSAWDRQSSITSELVSDLNPSRISRPDASGYWVIGAAASVPVLIRYDIDGAARFIRHIETTDTAYDLQIAAAPDGGVVVAEKDLAHHCVYQRYDASGNLRWSNAALVQNSDGYSCDPFRLDGPGGVWVRGRQVFNRLGFDDGAVTTSVGFDGVDINGFVGDPFGPNLFVLTGDQPNDPDARAAISKLSGHGGVLWQWLAPQDNGQRTYLSEVDVDTGGNVVAFGTTGQPPDYAFYGVQVSTSGVTRWVRSYPDLGFPGALATAAGQSFVVASLPTTPSGELVNSLARIDQAGALAWTKTIGTSSYLEGCSISALRATPAAEAVAFFDCRTPDHTVELARFAMNGTKTVSTAIAPSYVWDTQLLADGSALTILGPDVQILPDGSTRMAPPFLQRNAANGALLPAPRVTAAVPAVDGLAAAGFGSDGSGYLLSTNYSTHAFELDRVAGDGSLAWRRTGAGYWWGGNGLTTVVPVGEHVCIAGLLESDETIACYASADGQPQPVAQFDHGVQAFNVPSFAHAVGGDAVELIFLGSDNTTHLAVANVSGAVLHNTTPLLPPEQANAVGINDSGDALVVTTGTTYVRLGMDGTRRYAGSLSLGGATLFQPYLANDGSGLLLASGDGLRLARLNDGGTVQWSQTLPAPAIAQLSYNFSPSIVSTAAAVYVSATFGGYQYSHITPFPVPVYVAKVSTSTGEIAWDTTVPSIAFKYPKLALDQASGNLLVVSGWPNRIHEQLLDGPHGATLRDEFRTCDADYCQLFDSSVGGDGVLRVAADVSSVTTGDIRRVFAQEKAYAVPSGVRIGQAGLDGAWFGTYEGGQGFTFDYIASAATIFMPWFTFAATPLNDPADLAWYTLQGGGIDANATSADLAIAVSNPGAFNSGSVPGRQVGTAHLSFSDCSSGTLYYQFEAGTNGGAGGMISLTRLTPSTDPCLLAGGTAPAQNPSPPAQGFDARQSGSWFDPTTGGQGIELTVIPAGTGSGGLLFAPWFTFDPPGSSDEATHQHWFTLQGDLASAVNGKVTLPIYRIIGGGFDGVPTSNFAAVGHATLTMHGCDTAQLDYQFDASEVAHAFGGLSGTSHLIKIGGCAP